MTLNQFLNDNREELIKRTRAKVSNRSSPPIDPTELEEGVPVFLAHLSAALAESVTGERTDGSTEGHHPTTAAIAKSAAVHGRTLLKFGFTIEQVVHDYGDICQAVTELAEERSVTLTVDEFHTLNRCLDDAIAGAVSSWSEGWRERTAASETGKRKKSDAFKRHLGQSLLQAKTAVDVLRDGRVGIGGSTGALLHRALLDMSALIDKAEEE
jgi:hypothetical protein